MGRVHGGQIEEMSSSDNNVAAILLRWEWQVDQNCREFQQRQRGMKKAPAGASAFNRGWLTP